MSYDTRQPPQGQPSPGTSPGDSAAPPKNRRKRSGSEKRRRERIIAVRVYDTEGVIIGANAKAVHQKPSGFLRSLGTGFKRPDERRPKLPELAPFRAIYGKLGIQCSNAAQLLRLANRGEYPDIQEVRDTHTKLNAAADELAALIRGYSGDCER